MLSINRMTDYATLVMTRFATEPTRAMSAADLANALPLPSATIRKLLKTLAREGLLVSQRGRYGGFRLARPAAEITLAEVMAAMDGPLSLTPCSHDGPGCSLSPVCVHRFHLGRIDQEIRALLEGTSLAQMAAPRMDQEPLP